YHATLFEFLRNDDLDAKDYAFGQNTGKNPFRWNQYGFTLGGPVRIPKLFDGRNRLFFLSNFEGFRDRKSLTDFYNVPTAAMRQGNFVGLPQLYDPASRSQEGSAIAATPFAGNQILQNRWDPIALKLLQFVPLPNVNTGSFNSNLQEN